MAINFCPYCGCSIQPDFCFCPRCGHSLPTDLRADTSCSPSNSAVSSPAPSPSTSSFSPREGQSRLTVPAYTRRSYTTDPSVLPVSSPAPPPSTSSNSPRKNQSRLTIPAYTGRSYTTGPSVLPGCKRKLQHDHEEEHTLQVGSSPSKEGHGGKRCRSDVSILGHEGEELEDSTHEQRWYLQNLLGENQGIQMYLACRADSNKKEELDFLVKLGLRDGRIYTEQNFYQRVAQPDKVLAWLKGQGLPPDTVGILHIEAFGIHNDMRFLVLERPGRSLQALLAENHGRLSPSRVLAIGSQLLQTLRFVHEQGYAHANLQPSAVYLHRDDPDRVLLADFSLASRFSPSGQHVPYQPGQRQSHIGPIAFCSVDAHRGAVVSRRGDLFMLAYSLLAWMGGHLPWVSAVHLLQALPQLNAETVMLSKLHYEGAAATLVQDVMEEHHTPERAAMLDFLMVVFSLLYDEVPDYSKLLQILSSPTRLDIDDSALRGATPAVEDNPGTPHTRRSGKRGGRRRRH
uniref:serine/threonine-protein kinase VRK3-like isoform X2 n=1 Tax=Myxine glutinosa TaxID=7769 RepID=UPI0035900802